MALSNGVTFCQVDFVGEVGVSPRLVRINTTDILATIVAANYLQPQQKEGFVFVASDFFAINYSGGQGWFTPSIATNGVITLTQDSSGVVLPTIANHIAVFTDTGGTIGEDAATAINGGNIQAGLSGTAGYLASFPATLARGSLRLVGANSSGDTVTQITNASQAAARVYTIPDGGQSASSFLLTDNAGTQAIATGSLSLTLGNITAAAGAISATLGAVSAGTTVTAGTGVTSTTGNITAGSAGNAGTFISFPATTGNGTLILSALNASGAFNTTVRNSVMGQSSVISIPDPGAATANFLLNTGAANVLSDNQQIVGINSILIASVGTWTRTRIAQANYVLRHTAAADTSVIGIDITNAIRVAASKGFQLDSLDVIYSIGTLALVAHTLTLDKVTYADNVAVAVTSVPLTGSLSIATQAQPYVTNLAVTTPAFSVTADSKYVVELTVNAAATTDYDYYGLNLRFSQTIG